MAIQRSVTVLLSLFIFSFCQAQCSFDTSTNYHQRSQLADLYADLMEHFRDIEIIDSLVGVPVPSPQKNLQGEATFVFEIADDGRLLNVFITEFWSIVRSKDDYRIGDRIVFVEGEQKGFDLERVKQSKLNPLSREAILYLMENQWATRKFKVVKPRERNLKYARVRFE